MDFSPLFHTEDALAQLLHDLRQPLGNIALSATYLSMILDSADERVQEQIVSIQAQVERLSRMLDCATPGVRRIGVQRADRSREDRESTKPQTASVA